ncbi:hypothetical protein [Nocardioides sp.]
MTPPDPAENPDLVPSGEPVGDPDVTPDGEPTTQPDPLEPLPDEDREEQ